MGIVSLLRSVIGGSDSIEEPKIVSNFNTLQTLLNGNLDFNNLAARAGITAAQLAAAILDAGGVNDGTVVRRGKSVVATTEARTNTAYGLLATPDRVSGVVLPTDGLIAVAYQATWQESVLGAAKAAIFIGANQLKRTVAGGGPIVQETIANSGGGTALDFALVSTAGGLISTGGGGAYTGDVTTGQIVGGYTSPMVNSLGALVNDLAPGGPCLIFAAAGTYDVSVQFKATSGSVTAKNRKLWVWTIGF